MKIEEMVKKSLQEILPRIDGVNWKVIITEMPTYPTEHRITVAASFEVDEIESMKAMPFIFKKIHQITCGGQIKLELETI